VKALPLLRRLVLALSATALGALPLRAQPPPPAGRALFFTEPLYKGECLVVEAGGGAENLEVARDRRGRPFNDRIASVRLEGNVRAGVFEDSQFRGAFTWLTRDTPDLSALSLGSRSDRSWKTAVSSVQVQDAPAGSGAFIAWTRRDAERVVRAAYRDMFSREPDPAGLRVYIDRLLESGWTEVQLRDSLRRSDEFKSRDFDAIILRSYQEELGRPPDPSGIAAYKRGLGRGMTEAEVRAELRRSPETGAHRARQTVIQAYRDLLRRDPDPAGLDNYVKQITQKGWDEAKVREALRRSDEYRNLKR
jgi:hypothetical protein